MTLHHLIVTFKTLGACASLEPRYCRMAHSVASRDALALATAEVLGLSLPDISCPRRRVDRITANVCFWHKADITLAWTNVCFRGNSGHGSDIPQRPVIPDRSRAAPSRRAVPRPTTGRGKQSEAYKECRALLE